MTGSSDNIHECCAMINIKSVYKLILNRKKNFLEQIRGNK